MVAGCLSHSPERASYPAPVDFTVTHHFEAPVDEVAAAMLDEDYQTSLGNLGALKERRLLSQEIAPDGTAQREIHYVLDIDVGGAARRFLGDAKPSWIEEAKWDPDDLKWTWVVHPDIAGELLAANGTIELRDKSPGSERRVAGRVKVKVPFYGARVEEWIVQGIKRTYEEEAGHLASWLVG